MNIQKKYLEKLKVDKTFLDIYTDHFEESIYGFILDFNDDFLLLEQFTEIGKANGIAILKIENITRIKWSGNDIETTSNFALKERQGDKIGKINIEDIQAILKSIQSIFGYVNVSIQEIDTGICFIGEIVEMDAEIVIIKEYGTYASLDRKMLMLSLNEITKIEAGSEYEQNLFELFNKKTTANIDF